ncbi:cytochrome P450 [Nostoc sp. UHCC 0702]|nr:cytochrome P450 [Nostoc sp. UHCC 0702]
MITHQKNSLNNVNFQLPNGSQTIPLFQTLRAIFQPIELLESSHERYGDIFMSNFSVLPPQLIISSPQAIQEIFTADSKLFDSGSGNSLLQPLVGANSVILLDGDRHSQQRKLLMPTFHGERMRAYGQAICEITQQAISQWTIGQEFIARPQMQNISLQVILKTVFGLKQGERYQQIKQVLIAMLDTFNSPWKSSLLFFKFLQKDLGAWSPWGNYIRQRQRLDELVYQEIHERRTQGELAGDDILSLLMSSRDEKGEPMTDVELRDELMTMLFAGHETTAIALAWALYWIHYIPEVREKLLQELNSIDVKNANPTTIAQLPYLNAVCSETLRIYPIAFFSLPRILRDDMQLFGYYLPKGMYLSVCIYLTHHRPDIYPEPKQFRPERFLERQFSPYEFLPFGGGNRRCIGMAFAMFEMKLVLATILSRYSLQLLESRPLLPVRRGLVFTPAGGVHLMVKEKY